MTSTCPRTDVQVLQKLLHGQLSDAHTKSVEEHLLNCDCCAQALDKLSSQDVLILSMKTPAPPVPASEQQAIGGLLERLRGVRPPLVPADTASTGGFGQHDTPSQTAPLEDLTSLLAPPQGADEIGRLGPYRVLKVLGAGGMGVVFEAEDPVLRRAVALKAMKPALSQKTENRQRFLREARATAALEHDHIAAIHHVGEDRGVPFLAMPLLHGESLEARLGRQAEMPLAEVLRIGREMADGLAAAHAHGLIHRDIKPANIWLESVVRSQWSVAKEPAASSPSTAANNKNAAGATDDGPLTTDFRVKILDFGLARGADDEAGLTQSGVIAGTPAYMAPEQARGEPEARSDLFSLGCVLYRMTTQRLPFAGATTMAILQALATEQPKPPRALNPAVPQALSDLILKLLAKDPKDRPQTAGAVAETLSALERAEADKARLRRARHPARLLVAAALLLALGAAAWLYGPAVYRFATNQGVIVVETEDPDVEVTIRGDVVKVVDAKTGQEVTIRAGKYRPELTKGKPGLRLSPSEFTLERGGTQIVKVTMNPVEQDPKEPFVVLAREGRAEQKFAALAEAVAGTAGGDTIEIRGNGPFILEPLVLADKALTLRAGAGWRPVLKNGAFPERPFDKSGHPYWTPLINTRARLVVEGLEIHRDDSGREQGFPGEPVIFAHAAPLYVANCRFVLRPKVKTSVLTVQDSKALEMRQCQVVSDGPAHLASWVWVGGDTGKAVVANNLFVAKSGTAMLFHHREPESGPVAIRFEENTLIGSSLHLALDKLPKGGADQGPPLLLEWSGNIIDTEDSVLDVSQNLFAPESKALALPEVRKILRRLCRWQDLANVYPETLTCLRHGVKYANFKADAGDPRSLAEWQAFWDMAPSGSVQGKIRLAGGDLRARASSGPAALTPDDFRLAPGSAGKGAGPGGKDLGADVDLVGPGPVYEKWKETPAYQQWLKDSEQVVRAEAPIAKPFVVLAKGGRAEQKFPALTDAVEAAHNGDTIEIRGDGPFVLSPIHLRDKPLTLRAGAGSWPVLALAPEAVAADLPLLSTRAALTLEGLDFHRDAGGKPGASSLRHIHSQRAPLAVANCRFVLLRSKNPGLISAITAEKSLSFQVRNCLFLGDWHAGPGSGWMVPGGRMVVVNCLFLTRSHALTIHINEERLVGGGRQLEEVPTASLQVLNNTMISYTPPVGIAIGLRNAHKDVPGQPPPLRLEARRNLGVTGLLHFLYFSSSKEADDFLEREARSLPTRLFALEDQGNHIAAGAPLVTFRILPHDGGARHKPAITTLEEYREYWKLGKTDSIVGPIRFQKDLSPKMSAPEKLTPEDFRVPGSSDKGQGADVDLVGPGPAYERWQTTPEYQQWLKDTGTLKQKQ